MREVLWARLGLYRNYMVGVLLIILAFNYTDRFALGLVLDEIKADLRLSDSQLGFLSGIAFALFYAIMGIPIARWSDTGNRVHIIAWTTGLWSVLVALCGTAGSFVQLVAIRIGVGVGEAGCIPPAHSLIADYFSRAERPRAAAIYMQGTTLSVVMGYFLAGWLNEFYGWRLMFVMLGLPGLAMALLAWGTLREPRLRGDQSERDQDEAGKEARDDAMPGNGLPGVLNVLSVLWGNKTFLHLMVSYSLLSFFNYGLLNWQPAFFSRSFGLKTGELGSWFTVVYGLSTLGGLYLGGEWAARRAHNDEGRQLKVMALANAIFGGGVWAPIYFSHSYYVAFVLMGISNFGATTIYGPLFGAFQTLVAPRMRALSIAIVCMFANLIGLGLGPLAVGALSDVFRPMAGDESLRYALLAMCPGFLWASWHLWVASRTVEVDLAALPNEREGIDFTAKPALSQNTKWA